MTNVVVVGAGLAGLMCAYELVSAGKCVTLVYQGDLEHTSSYYAQGGIAGAWLNDDSVKQHMNDTHLAGAGLCIADVVQHFCESAPDFIQTLIDLGVPFDQNQDGSFRLTKEGAHSIERIFHSKDHTGFSIIQTLVSTLKSNPNIHWVNASIEGLIQARGQSDILGVIVSGQPIYSAATVLATGGFSNLFSLSTNPKKNIGEGIALAYMAGAKLADLEFIQFHPTVYCANGFPPLLLSEALRGEGAFLVNKNNDRFMKNYHDLADLAPRDVVARAIMQEPVPKLNIAPIMTTIEQRFPTIYQALKLRGFAAQDFEIPVMPVVHYTLGGIVADIHGKTSCPGLYAIGECAVTGFHGANRLASNSLLEAGVMGQSCGSFLSSMNLKVQSDVAFNRLEIAPLPSASLIWLGERCRQNLGVIRDDVSLKSAIGLLESSDFFEHPLYQFLGVILQSALYRNESRGGHFRSDAVSSYETPLHSITQRFSELYLSETI